MQAIGSNLACAERNKHMLTLIVFGYIPRDPFTTVLDSGFGERMPPGNPHGWQACHRFESCLPQDAYAYMDRFGYLEILSKQWFGVWYWILWYNPWASIGCTITLWWPILLVLYILRLKPLCARPTLTHKATSNVEYGKYRSTSEMFRGSFEGNMRYWICKDI